ADALLAKGHTVRAIVRNPAKAADWVKRGVQLIAGDVNDVAVLTKALTGVDGAYLLVPPNVVTDDPLGWYEQVAKTFRQAVEAASLKRLVFLSSEAAHLPTGNGPIKGLHAAERILKGAAPTLTFLRASYFQENWQSLAGLAREQGILPTFLADPAAKRSMIATRDIGQVAADLLLEAHPPAIVELASRENFSANDAAAAYAAAFNRPVAVVQPPHDQWAGILTGAGLSPAFAGLIVEMNDGINSGHVRFSGDGDQRKGPTSLAETVKSWA
ncbi:MAG: NmrA family NAD(P)-binding protein, partial [Alphaproteobacteria bacterium]